YNIEVKSGIKKAASLVVTNHGFISGVDIINGSINNIGKKANVAGYVLNNEEDGVIENCFVSMNTNGSNIKFGFVGINLGKITKCSTTVSVSSKDIAGGFCGSNSGEISDCKSEGTVKATSKKGVTICGGFVVENSGMIKNSSSKGEVEGQEYVGGFAGINNDKGEISFCKSNCNVNSRTCFKFINCGGIVGLNIGKVKNCSFKGKVSKCIDSEKIYLSIEILSGLACFAIPFVIICIIESPNHNSMELVDYLSHAAITMMVAMIAGSFGFFWTWFFLLPYSAATATLYVGGFCGCNIGEISHCKSEGNINGDCCAGGFVGQNSGKIENSITTISIDKGKCAGGFCGNNSGEISGSRSEGNAVANTKTVETKCGGFVGNNDKQGKISGCISTGSAEGQEYVGGFCGDNTGEISKSKSEGNAKASTKVNTNICGGFIGENSGTVKDSYAKGSATGEEYVGGFAGVNKNEIVDCNAYGKATAKTKTHTALAGGFVGENEKGKIANCVAIGGADSRSSSGQAKAGGFVGINEASIMDSKASGNVYLSAGTCHKDDGCGGFVGKNDQGGSIDGCYAEATVETTNKKKGGGFVGEAKSKSTIKNSQCKTKIVTKSGAKVNTKFCENKDKKILRPSQILCKPPM
ncbi:MAG: hypothetical protein K2G97_00355, partial [Oscillospiraceae bacterium]|nr:hypothetical protein [Oscillospiraceae bacterium]